MCILIHDRKGLVSVTSGQYKKRGAAPMNRRSYRTCFLISFTILILTGGCTSLFIDPLTGPLNSSLQKQSDLQLIHDGAPALLLLLDGFIDSNPDNKKLLMSGARGYTSYAATVYEYGDKERAAKLSTRAKDYGLRLLCQTPSFSGTVSGTFERFKSCLSKTDTSDVDALFWGGYSWATWIKFQEGSPASLADLPMVEQIMLRVLELDETYYYGSAHLFLGVYYGSRPEMFGGRPEESRKHFEKAIAASNRQFLLAQVTFAEIYARMTFNRELYESLLKEVLESKTDIEELTSSNELAKVMARRLLSKTDEYF